MRPSKDQWGLDLAIVTSHRATCLRRQVGCVLVNKRGHVLATGYNGVASGQKHCNEKLEVLDRISDDGVKPVRHVHTAYPHACEAAFAPSGTQLDACQAIHAEQNALLQCRDVHEIHTVYVTTSPCITCVKLLLNTSCERIVFLEEYPHTTAQALWAQAGRSWEKFNISDTQ